MKDEKPKKLANAVAIAIEQDIIFGRLEVGAPLGTEAELCLRYGASRWAIREALAVVQNDGLVIIRRGRSGGAIVNAAPDQSLAAAICGFLLYARIENEHIIQARLILDRLLFEAAAQVPDRDVPDRAIQLLSDSEIPTEVFYQSIELSGAGITGVLARALAQLTRCRLALYGIQEGVSPPLGISKSLRSLRRQQLRAFAALDADAAAVAASETAVIFRGLFNEYSTTTVVGNNPETSRAIAANLAEILHPGQAVKAAGVVATMLMFDVIAKGSEDSGFLGLEAALTARYGVPRNLLREGIRILERDGFVRADKGRNGGIRAGEPDISEIVSRAIRIFEFLRSSEREILALARECRMQAIELVLIDEASAAAVFEELRHRDEAGTKVSCNDVFVLLAEHTGNSFLLFVEMLCSRLLPDLGNGARKDLLNMIVDTVRARDSVRGRRAVARFHERGG